MKIFIKTIPKKVNIKNISEYKFILDLDRIHNKLFANLLKDLALKLKIKVLEIKVNDLNHDFDSNH